MTPLIVSGLFEIGSKLIERLLPDPEQRAKAQLELLRQQQAGELEELNTRMAAILAEAKSADGYTSRARPTLLYVFYILILAGLPMGVLSAISPGTATDVAAGFGAWLRAIPDSIVDMATFVMSGYILSRGIEKVKGAA